jgi:mRNA-degrading endonuclease RelE of RelBE toxin-antitoxin system
VRVVIVETRAFTARIQQLLSDEEYRQVQLALVARPAAGAVIAGTGGLRKLRSGATGRGKRGGLRLIYYWHQRSGRLLLLLAYAKNERDDLTGEQKALLRAIVEKEYR